MNFQNSDTVSLLGMGTDDPANNLWKDGSAVIKVMFNDQEGIPGDTRLKFINTWHDILINEFQGRPHWGKNFDRTFQNIAQVYPSENVAKFKATVQQFDPRGLFRNALLEGSGLLP